MIDVCPPDSEEITASKCSRTSRPYSHHLDLPVHSAATNNTYKNIFCAICHNDSSRLTPFTVDIVCSNQNIIDDCGLTVVEHILQDENYRPGALRWSKYLEAGDSLNNCTTASYPIVCSLSIRTDLPPHSRLCFADEGFDFTPFYADTGCLDTLTLKFLKIYCFHVGTDFSDHDVDKQKRANKLIRRDKNRTTN